MSHSDPCARCDKPRRDHVEVSGVLLCRLAFVARSACPHPGKGPCPSDCEHLRAPRCTLNDVPAATPPPASQAAPCEHGHTGPCGACFAASVARTHRGSSPAPVQGEAPDWLPKRLPGHPAGCNAASPGGMCCGWCPDDGASQGAGTGGGEGA